MRTEIIEAPAPATPAEEAAERRDNQALVAAAWASNTYIPVRHLYGTFGSRNSVHLMRCDGLKLAKIPHLGLCIRRSDLHKYLEDKAAHGL